MSELLDDLLRELEITGRKIYALGIEEGGGTEPPGDQVLIKKEDGLFHRGTPSNLVERVDLNSPGGYERIDISFQMTPGEISMAPNDAAYGVAWLHAVGNGSEWKNNVLAEVVWIHSNKIKLKSNWQTGQGGGGLPNVTKPLALKTGESVDVSMRIEAGAAWLWIGPELMLSTSGAPITLSADAFLRFGHDGINAKEGSALGWEWRNLLVTGVRS